MQITNLSRANLNRRHALVAAAALGALVSVGCGVFIVAGSPLAGIHAHLDASNPDHVRILESVPIRFDRPVDLGQVQVELSPAARFDVVVKPDRLVLVPQDRWSTDKRYSVLVGGVRTRDHKGSLNGWRATFTTQPQVGVAGFMVNDLPVAGQADIPLHSKLTVAFTVPMNTASVTLLSGGQPIPASQLTWSPDRSSVSLLEPVLVPYSPVTLGVQKSGTSAAGDTLSDVGQVVLVPQALEPSNASSGIRPGFTTLPPIQVSIENSGPARPQSGFQEADMVYEYLSEYGITRMAAMYFNNPPPLIGPVRSCRMITPYINFAFTGLTMCSGASVGTLHYMFGGGGTDIPLVPGSINDFDQGGHFYLARTNFAPHNVYTDADRALRLRAEWPLATPSYQVDPPHPDIPAGTPFDPPVVGLHGVAYSYDAASQQYLRFDHGTPFTERETGQQLHVKNIVLINVPFRDAGWVEDENGGAHSIWYLMNGSGSAQVWSDGRLTNATWHMGDAVNYWDNHQPLWLSDETGKPIQLNTGLTWIHVLGIGQRG